MRTEFEIVVTVHGTRDGQMIEDPHLKRVSPGGEIHSSEAWKSVYDDIKNNIGSRIQGFGLAPLSAADDKVGHVRLYAPLDQLSPEVITDADAVISEALLRI